MGRYIVLLRGVNVGGHNKVPMAGFRELLASLGHTDVATYLQSGNAVFTSSKSNTATLATGIAQALAQEMSVEVNVLVVTKARFRKVIAANPMAKLDDDPTHLYVAFLSGKPKAALLKAVDVSRFEPDRFKVVGDVAYLHYPNGMGRSKLDPGTLFPKTGVWATARNWRTVLQLDELAADT
ncbi:MAG: DUF1697 domain-containing protein [Candidatus Nanopelagicales bacterium]